MKPSATVLPAVLVAFGVYAAAVTQPAAACANISCADAAMRGALDTAHRFTGDNSGPDAVLDAAILNDYWDHHVRHTATVSARAACSDALDRLRDFLAAANREPIPPFGLALSGKRAVVSMLGVDSSLNDPTINHCPPADIFVDQTPLTTNSNILTPWSVGSKPRIDPKPGGPSISYTPRAVEFTVFGLLSGSRGTVEFRASCGLGNDPGVVDLTHNSLGLTFGKLSTSYTTVAGSNFTLAPADDGTLTHVQTSQSDGRFSLATCTLDPSGTALSVSDCQKTSAATPLVDPAVAAKSLNFVADLCAKVAVQVSSRLGFTGPSTASQQSLAYRQRAFLDALAGAR